MTRAKSCAWFAVVPAPAPGHAEYSLGQIGLHDAAMIAGAQARLVSGLQYPLVTGDDAAMASDDARPGTDLPSIA